MNAWEEERRMATTDNTRAQYQHAGPIQNSSKIGSQEKHPMTAPARIVLYYMVRFSFKDNIYVKLLTATCMNCNS
jgi:hypothetical protein